MSQGSLFDGNAARTVAEAVDGQPWPLEKPCSKCKAQPGAEGRIQVRGGQNCLYCACGQYNGYNVPKAKTGQPQSHVTRPGEAKAGKRQAILERDAFRCVYCGRAAPEVQLHVDHLVPIAWLEDAGATEEELRSDYNLAALCAACNLGKTDTPPLPRDAVRILLAIMRARKAHDEFHAQRK